MHHITNLWVDIIFMYCCIWIIDASNRVLTLRKHCIRASICANSVPSIARIASSDIPVKFRGGNGGGGKAN